MSADHEGRETPLAQYLREETGWTDITVAPRAVAMYPSFKIYRPRIQLRVDDDGDVRVFYAAAEQDDVFSGHEVSEDVPEPRRTELLEIVRCGFLLLGGT